MLLALGAASSALDALQIADLVEIVVSANHRLQSGLDEPVRFREQLRAGKLDPGFRVQRVFADIAGHHERAACGAKPVIDAGSTTSAPTSQSDALKDLFSQLDANGDGQISKSEFENALGAGGTNIAQADDVFSKMDKNGDGSVSLDEMSSALKGAGGNHHHHHAAGSDGSRRFQAPPDRAPIRCCRRCRAHPLRRPPTATARPRRQ